MKSWKVSFLSIFVAVLVVGLSSSASAAECVGVSVPNTVTVDGTELTLNGQGLREATVFKVDVYVASLYVKSRSNNGQKLATSNSPKRLVLSFVRDVDRSDVTDAYKESFKKTAGSKHSALAPKLNKLNSWMSAMEEGDTQTYTYTPDDGLEVNINGKTKGTIEGKDFAEAFFSIWLGANPPNDGLKRGLLGGSCD
ncbi:MAG: chalcone isomerase family protein [Persicimonas sp.]